MLQQLILFTVFCKFVSGSYTYDSIEKISRDNFSDFKYDLNTLKAFQSKLAFHADFKEGSLLVNIKSDISPPGYFEIGKQVWTIADKTEKEDFVQVTYKPLLIRYGGDPSAGGHFLQPINYVDYLMPFIKVLKEVGQEVLKSKVSSMDMLFESMVLMNYIHEAIESKDEKLCKIFYELAYYLDHGMIASTLQHLSQSIKLKIIEHGELESNNFLEIEILDYNYIILHDSKTSEFVEKLTLGTRKFALQMKLSSSKNETRTTPALKYFGENLALYKSS